MNKLQRQWVLVKALHFIENHINEDKLDEEKYKAMYDEMSKICQDAKYNRECVELFNSIYACFDGKEQEHEY